MNSLGRALETLFTFNSPSGSNLQASSHFLLSRLLVIISGSIPKMSSGFYQSLLTGKLKQSLAPRRRWLVITCNFSRMEIIIIIKLRTSFEK